MIICLGLFTLLLSTLFYWYHSLNQQKGVINSLRGPLLEERYAHQRLKLLFSKIEIPICTAPSDKSLVFIFDRGPYPASDLAGQILARLYYDAEREALCLGVWPHPKSEKREPSQTCVLLDKLQDCSFEFYYPPNPFRKPVNPEEVGSSKPKEGWQFEWKDSYQCLPALIKVILTRPLASEENKTRTFEYLFDLQVPVIYSKESV